MGWSHASIAMKNDNQEVFECFSFTSAPSTIAAAYVIIRNSKEITLFYLASDPASIDKTKSTLSRKDINFNVVLLENLKSQLNGKVKFDLPNSAKYSNSPDAIKILSSTFTLDKEADLYSLLGKMNFLIAKMTPSIEEIFNGRKAVARQILGLEESERLPFDVVDKILLLENAFKKSKQAKPDQATNGNPSSSVTTSVTATTLEEKLSEIKPLQMDGPGDAPSSISSAQTVSTTAVVNPSSHSATPPSDSAEPTSVIAASKPAPTDQSPAVKKPFEPKGENRWEGTPYTTMRTELAELKNDENNTVTQDTISKYISLVLRFTNKNSQGLFNFIVVLQYGQTMMIVLAPDKTKTIDIHALNHASGINFSRIGLQDLQGAQSDIEKHCNYRLRLDNCETVFLMKTENDIDLAFNVLGKLFNSGHGIDIDTLFKTFLAAQKQAANILHTALSLNSEKDIIQMKREINERLNHLKRIPIPTNYSKEYKAELDGLKAEFDILSRELPLPKDSSKSVQLTEIPAFTVSKRELRKDQKLSVQCIKAAVLKTTLDCLVICNDRLMPAFNNSAPHKVKSPNSTIVPTSKNWHGLPAAHQRSHSTTSNRTANERQITPSLGNYSIQ